MGMVDTLDRVAVRRGALGVLMFVAPTYVFAKILSAGSDDSFAWLILMGGLLFGATFGGYAGARDRPSSPISHGALSAAGGLSIVLLCGLLVQALQGELGLAVILFAVVILQIGTALGCLGGLLAARGVRPK